MTSYLFVWVGVPSGYLSHKGVLFHIIIIIFKTSFRHFYKSEKLFKIVAYEIIAIIDGVFILYITIKLFIFIP